MVVIGQREACPASGENGGKLATSAPVSFRPGVKQAAILFDAVRISEVFEKLKADLWGFFEFLFI